MRDIEFTEKLDVAILSQRRVIPPYGMAGGEPGSVGVNEWHRRQEDGTFSIVNLGGSNQCVMAAGDRIVINTPGGGGYGVEGGERAVKTREGVQVRASGSLAAMRAAQSSSS